MDHSNMNIVELSPLDQTIPRLYVHKLFCFPFPDASLQSEAVEALEQALSATILKWPFITGIVVPSDTNEHEVQLQYATPAAGEIGDHVLIVRNLSAPEYPWAYQQLADANMPLSAMNKDVLSTVPEWPQHGEPYPALAIQANFIEGGLILCFAFHHAVADGGAFCTFLRAFAAAMKEPVGADSGILMAVESRIAYTKPDGAEVRALESFPEYDSTSVPAHHAAYKEVTTRILTFSAETIQKLEAAIKEKIRKDPSGPSFVSNIACLSGLIWVAVVRARRNRLPAFETTKIGIAVNARSVMSPKLPENYFGNAVVHTNATAKVFELVDADPDSSDALNPISTATLAFAASRMRRATQQVDAKYVEERLKTFSALPDPTETSRAYARAMDTAHTGLDFSSWRDQGADVEFAIPGLGTSTVQFWRKTWSPNEGAYNILPRVGGSKGPADWEVSLGLSMEDMEKVCSAEELGRWTSRIVEILTPIAIVVTSYKKSLLAVPLPLSIASLAHQPTCVGHALQSGCPMSYRALRRLITGFTAHVAHNKGQVVILYVHVATPRAYCLGDASYQTWVPEAGDMAAQQGSNISNNLASFTFLLYRHCSFSVMQIAEYLVTGLRSSVLIIPTFKMTQDNQALVAVKGAFDNAVACFQDTLIDVTEAVHKHIEGHPVPAPDMDRVYAVLESAKDLFGDAIAAFQDIKSDAVPKEERKQLVGFPMPTPDMDEEEAAFQYVKERFSNFVFGLKDLTWDKIPEPAREYIRANPKLTAFQLVSVLLVACPGIVVAPALGVLGFSGIGPGAGTAAAGYQSINGATTMFSMLQSAAMGGYGVGAVNAIVQVPAVVAAGAAELPKWLGDDTESSKKIKAKL